MIRKLAVVVGVLVLLFAAAQFVRPEVANPPVVPDRTIAARLGAASPLPPVLDRACGDCHSNQTEWPGWTNVAPLSWLMADGVNEGRKAVNFSEWATYPPKRQDALLDQSCRDATDGKMPPAAYTMFKPRARLSNRDVKTLCAAARETGRG